MDLNNLPSAKVLVSNVSALSEDEYALARRQGLGASDASVFLGLQSKWRTTDDLIIEKSSKVITDAERAVGKKDVVRKGRDLEPMNMAKFTALTGVALHKPEHMYAIKDSEYLTVNYDGVAEIKQLLIPVECKFVSTFGDKYYDRTRACTRETQPNQALFLPEQIQPLAASFPIASLERLGVYCETRAAEYGVPAYYYAQLQQQMLGLEAPYGYLSALHDKGWELCVYGPVPFDSSVAHAIKVEGFKTWQRIMRIRNLQ